MIVGIGLDLCPVERMREVLARQGDRFLERTCGDEEATAVRAAGDPAQRLAGRWAAKEALLKALGTGWSAGIAFREVAILNNDAGAPRIVLSGAAQAAADRLGVTALFCSITHDGGIAAAVVVAEKA